MTAAQASDLRVLRGGRQRREEARIEVLSALDEFAIGADRIYEDLQQLQARYAPKGLKDVRWMRVLHTAGAMTVRARSARAEYAALTGPDGGAA